jgi:hypothetical protein
MCQGNPGEQTVLTPFEEDAAFELASGDRYAQRVVRLAIALYDLLGELSGEELGPRARQLATAAEAVLEQESAAAAAGGEA